MQLKVLSFWLAASIWPVAETQGQQGMLSARTQFAMVHGQGLNSNPAPLRGIILWHGAPGWEQPRNQAGVRAMDSIMELAKRRAQHSNGYAFGDGSHYAVQHMTPLRVTVEGAEFDLSREDSVLVIMVTVPDTFGRRTIQTARLSAASAPNIDFTRQGTGSDFRLVPVPHFTAVRLLTAYLQESETIQAFLR